MKSALPTITCLLLMTLACAAEMRTWTNTADQKITAELVHYDKENGKVTIRKKNKKTYTLALSTLSENDQKWLEQWHQEQEKKKAEEEAKRAELNKNAGKTISMKSDGDLSTSYHVYYPKSFDASKKHPLLILFSPGGGGKGMLNSVRQGCDALGWIAIGCDTFRNNGNEKEFFKRFASLLPHIEKNITHDPESLYMGGFSGGALRAYGYSAEFQRPWKGILAYGGWLGPQGVTTAKKMRVAIVNGDKDKNANHYIERDSGLLKKKRCKVKHFSFPGGHSIAPPDATEKALRWIADKE